MGRHRTRRPFDPLTVLALLGVGAAIVAIAMLGAGKPGVPHQAVPPGPAVVVDSPPAASPSPSAASGCAGCASASPRASATEYVRVADNEVSFPPTTTAAPSRRPGPAPGSTSSTSAPSRVAHNVRIGSRCHVPDQRGYTRGGLPVVCTDLYGQLRWWP